MVKVKTLKPLQTYMTNIVPREHLSQIRTLKLHINLCTNHYRGRVTNLQRLRATILLPKLIRKTNLVILEAANTTYVLILILITQTYTDIDVCKSLFQPLLCAIPNLYFHFFYLFRTHIILFFCNLGADTNQSGITTKTNRIATSKIFYVGNQEQSPLAPGQEE